MRDLDENENFILRIATEKIAESMLPLRVARREQPCWVKGAEAWFDVEYRPKQHITICPSAKEMSAFVVGFELAFLNHKK